jgi:ABC-type multidrug transport system fused ATPase/permease subunit
MLARLFGREMHERQRFDETAGRVAHNMVQIVRMRTLASEIVQGAFFTTGGLLLLLAGYRIFIEQTLSTPDLLKLALLLPLCTYSTESLAGMYASLRASGASARRVFALLDLPPLPPDPPDAVDPGPLRRAIELRGVGYSVGARTVLEGIDLTIPQGKRVVIQGPTGAGKSTLLSLIAGDLRHTAGSILLDGADIGTLRLSAWRERLGIVTQEALLLSGNVRDNLLYAVPDADDERLRAALAKALLGPASRALPLGLDTPVGNRGELLSGGERQRLTIARALLRDPALLLMDEPTSMLDRASRDLMLETILSASAGRTLVLVSHDESLSAIADVLVRLEAGRLAARA